MPVLEKLIALVAPFDCLVCNLEGALLCQKCFGKAIITKVATCYRCNKLSAGGATCKSCKSSTKLNGVTVTSHYGGAIKNLIGQLKYERAQSAADVCARLMTPLLNSSKFDIVVPVPSSPHRIRTRGYNQAALIAKAVARELGLPYSDALLRARDLHQVGLNRQDRLKQVAGLFAVRDKAAILNARILLIDDVITTGATMAECAKELRAGGARSIWGAAVAKH
jgi:competence protein ComFC